MRRGGRWQIEDRRSQSGDRATHRRARSVLTLAILLLSSGFTDADAQSAPEPPAEDAPGYAHMKTLLEKTIFKVDVLTLDVWIGGVAGRHLMARRGSGGGEAIRDSVARIAVEAQDAWARIAFERNVSLRQFVDGVDRNMRRAVEAGILASADARSILDSLPHWFHVLADRGIKDGDRLLYRITGDTLRTRFVTRSGETLVDQTDVGPERRLSVFGSYFAPKSEFRKGLVLSLLASH